MGELQAVVQHHHVAGLGDAQGHAVRLGGVQLALPALMRRGGGQAKCGLWERDPTNPIYPDKPL